MYRNPKLLYRDKKIVKQAYAYVKKSINSNTDLEKFRRNVLMKGHEYYKLCKLDDPDYVCKIGTLSRDSEERTSWSNNYNKNSFFVCTFLILGDIIKRKNEKKK
jgi:hypothetical protein